MRLAIFSLWVVVGVVTPALGQTPTTQAPTPVEKAEIQAAVERLGSDDFRVRERAGELLAKVGDRALPLLKAALQTSDDPEVTRRLQVLTKQFEIDRLTKPRRVTVSAKNRPVKEVLAELATQTGYKIRVENVTERMPITFECQEMPILEAVDQVCERAGVVSNIDDNDGAIVISIGDSSNPYTMYTGPFRIVATNVNANRSLQLSGLPRRSPLPPQPEFLNISFMVQSEPKTPLLNVGQPIVTKAIDDKGNSLIVAESANELTVGSAGANRCYSVGFNCAVNHPARQATTIKELRAKVAVEVLAENRIDLVIENIQAANGKKFVGRSLTIEVGKMTTQNNEVKLALTVRRNNGNPDDYSWLNGLHQRLELLDTNGVKYQSLGLEIQSNGPNVTTFQMQFIKPPNRKIGKPSQLHCIEWVPLSREIEFTFKDIPLP